MRIIFSLLGMGLCLSLSAQNFCYTSEKREEWFQKHPELRANFEKHQQEAAKADKLFFSQHSSSHTNAGKNAATATYTIPVVFHIIHKGGAENISDAQVIDAVNILTRDYNAMNADTANAVVQFKNMIGNTQVAFQLATKDPNGNCTNGIIRHMDLHTDWTGDYSEYAYTWPPTSYLNVYVVRSIDFGAAGYTYLPGSGIPAAMDAIVILNGYVGSIGSSNVGRSRALTHEVGHWLDLEHVWGYNNNPGQVCGDDGVSDTPITKGFSYCSLTNAAICTPGVVENVQNYMDYSYCSLMFTTGQSARMQNCLNSTLNGRNFLWTYNNLMATGIINPATNCSPKLEILPKPSTVICSGKSLSLLSFTYNANPTSYSWTVDNGGVVASATSASTSILFKNQGITKVYCTASNSYGSETKSLTVQVENGQTQITTQSMESFENSGQTLPVNWTRINPNGAAYQWSVTLGTASDGLRAMYIPGETFMPGAVAILESPSYDFKNNPEAQLTIRFAYAKESAVHTDVFKVQATKDCGGIWSDVWAPSSTYLASASGGITSNLYLSPIGNEWNLKSITDDPHFYYFKNEENVRFRYYFKEDSVSGYGNRFYLDQVTYTEPVGVNELTRNLNFNVFPNPTKETFKINFILSDPSLIHYQLVSVSGQIVVNGKEEKYTAGEHSIQLNDRAQLERGIYFVNMEVNGIKMSKKIIVE